MPRHFTPLPHGKQLFIVDAFFLLLWLVELIFWIVFYTIYTLFMVIFYSLRAFLPQKNLWTILFGKKEGEIIK